MYKSGSTFPPKHKVLFINQDDENAAGEDTAQTAEANVTGTRNVTRQGTADIDAVSPGTYRNQI